MFRDKTTVKFLFIFKFFNLHLEHSKENVASHRKPCIRRQVKAKVVFHCRPYQTEQERYKLLLLLEYFCALQGEEEEIFRQEIHFDNQIKMHLYYIL